MAIHSRVTIKDVARAAGVSTQTVSRVLNERPDVAPETRASVKAVIEALGYRPSALARGLIQGRSCTLGVVTAGLQFVGPSRALNGIAAEAEAHGYALLLKELPGFATTAIEPILNALLSHRVDGILWAVPEVGENRAWLNGQLAALPVPIVFLAMAPRAGVASLSIDNRAGARLATQHLLARGRRTIAHIAGPLAWWEAAERHRGWREALLEAGLEPGPCIEGNWSSRSGVEAATALLEVSPEVDAIFAANDQMALAVLLEAQRRGVRVPDDLAVVGFDDLAEAAYFVPPLTTVRQDQVALGGRAVTALVALIAAAREGEALPLKAEVLAPELIVRSSS